jgi:hypothetical protein
MEGLVVVGVFIEFVVFCLLFPIAVLLLLVLVAHLELNMLLTRPLPQMVVMVGLRHSTVPPVEPRVVKAVSEFSQIL